jgi:hypothetical protein
VSGVVFAHDFTDNPEPGSQTFLPGAEVRFRLTAFSTAGLRWIGVQLSPSGGTALADSLEVPSEQSAAVVTLEVTLQLGPAAGGDIAVGGFARGTDDGRAAVTLAGSPITVPIVRTLLLDTISVFRDQLFLRDGVGWRDLRAAPDGLLDGSVRYPLGSPPHGIDATPSGDTLVVTLPDRDEYAIVVRDRAAGTWATAATYPDSIAEPEGRPYGVRIVSGGVALAMRRTSDGTLLGSVVRIDPRTGAQSLVSGTLRGALVRTTGPRTVVVEDSTNIFNREARVYDTTSGAFGPPALVPLRERRVSLRAFDDATRLWGSEALYTLPELALQRRYRLNGQGPSIVEPGGSVVTKAVASRGLLRSRLDDGRGIDLLQGPGILDVQATPVAGQYLVRVGDLQWRLARAQPAFLGLQSPPSLEGSGLRLSLKAATPP